MWSDCTETAGLQRNSRDTGIRRMSIHRTGEVPFSPSPAATPASSLTVCDSEVYGRRAA